VVEAAPDGVDEPVEVVGAEGPLPKNGFGDTGRHLGSVAQALQQRGQLEVAVLGAAPQLAAHGLRDVLPERRAGGEVDQEEVPALLLDDPPDAAEQVGLADALLPLQREPDGAGPPALPGVEDAGADAVFRPRVQSLHVGGRGLPDVVRRLR
jgi:hypothetical protein